MKILAIGTNTVRNTFDIKKDEFEVQSFLWRSLFSITQEGNVENEEFKKLLSETSAEFAVIDLYSLSLFVNLRSDNFYESQSKNKSGSKAVSFFGDDEKIYQTLNVFSDMLTAKFKDKIVLIRTKKADKYRKNQIVRAIPSPERAFNEKMGAYEDYFIQISNCKVIDVLSNYFKDEYYRLGVSLVNYEEFAYDDIRYCLSRILSGRNIGSKFFIKLERYIAYGDFLEQSFKINWIFNSDNTLERFITNTSVPFVKAFYGELIKLNEFNISNERELLNEIKANCSEEVFEVASYHVAISSGKFDALKPSEAIFKYELNLLQKLVKICNNRLIENGVKGTVTVNNLKGYLPYLMRGSFKGSDRDIKIERPFKIDVLGSCISREIFKYIKDNVILNEYFFRASLLNFYDKKVEVSLDLLQDKNNFNGSKWRSDFMTTNLYRQAPERIKKTKAKYLLLDLYDVIELTYKIGEDRFVLDLDSTKLPFYQKLQEEYGVEKLGFYPYDGKELVKRLDSLAALLHGVYGENIIMTNVRCNLHFITDDGEIKRIERDAGEMLEKNKYLKFCQDYLAAKLNCFVLDFSDKFLADERFVWGESHVHYETEFFKYAASAVEDILRKRSTLKRVVRVPFRVRANRIIRLKKSKAVSEKAYSACIINPEDKYLLALDAKIIEDNLDYLEKLFEERSENFDIIELLDGIDEEHEKLKEYCIYKLQ